MKKGKLCVSLCVSAAAGLIFSSTSRKRDLVFSQHCRLFIFYFIFSFEIALKNNNKKECDASAEDPLRAFLHGKFEPASDLLECESGPRLHVRKARKKQLRLAEGRFLIRI